MRERPSTRQTAWGHARLGRTPSPQERAQGRAQGRVPVGASVPGECQWEPERGERGFQGQAGEPECQSRWERRRGAGERGERMRHLLLLHVLERDRRALSESVAAPTPNFNLKTARRAAARRPLAGRFLLHAAGAAGDGWDPDRDGVSRCRYEPASPVTRRPGTPPGRGTQAVTGGPGARPTVTAANLSVARSQL